LTITMTRAERPAATLRVKHKSEAVGS